METRKAKRTGKYKVTFTDLQDTQLYEHYPTMHFKELIALIGNKTRLEITKRANYLGIKKVVYATSGGNKGNNDTYTPEEKEILIANYASKTCRELQKLLPGKPRISINKKAYSMGLKKDPKLVKGYKGIKKTAGERAPKVYTYEKKGRKKNGKLVSDKAPKKREDKFPTRIVDPAEIIKVRVDHKTVLEIKKGRDVAQVVANYHANQARINKTIFKVN